MKYLLLLLTIVLLMSACGGNKSGDSKRENCIQKTLRSFHSQGGMETRNQAAATCDAIYASLGHY